MTNQPDILVPRDGEAGLVWAIVASGVLHAVTIVTVIAVPGLWKREVTPSVSYTVDLVASADPAGTNLTAGRAKAKPQAPPAPPPAPPPVAANAPEPPAPPVAEKVEPEPPKAEPVAPPPKPVAPEVPAPKPPMVKPEPAPIEKPAEKADVKLASKTVKPTPPKVKEPEPTAVVARATAVAKPTAVAKATAAVAKPTVPAAKPTVVVAQKTNPAVAPTSAPKGPNESETREKQIAAAVQRRADEQKIADAVERRAAAARQGNAASGGADGTSAGGPISVGSGTGTGGVVEGLDMILYRGQMERRIKENWVWAGEDNNLEVRVLFDVTPTGEIQNVRITGPSGNASFDASAARAVRAASPLAPPPEKYRDLFVRGVEITFRPRDLQS